MDIAALSVVMAQGQVQQQASVSLASKVMDNAEVNAQNLIKMMEQSVNPNLGSTIDVKL